MQSDAALVEATLEGNASAFEQLVLRHERAALARALAVIRSVHAAHEIAQDAFVQSYERLATLKKRSAYGAWLLQIVTRLAISSLRKNGRAVPLDSVPELSTSEKLPSDSERVILDAVAALPLREQTVVHAFYFAGHSTSEIARMTDCAVGTVTKRLQRARERLRKKLRKDDL